MSRSRTTRPAKGGSVDWKIVGRRIRELRGFDVTQAELAGRIGITQGHLSRIERGEAEVGAAVLLRIGREFEVALEWLLTGEGERERR